MIEYLQFRIGAISFYRATLSDGQCTIVRTRDISPATLSAINQAQTSMRSNPYVEVLQFREVVFVAGDAYYVAKPVALYEPLQRLSLEAATQIVLFMLDINLKLNSRQSGTWTMQPDNLLVRLSDRKVLLFPICDRPIQNGTYQLLAVWSYLVEQPSGIPPDQAMQAFGKRLKSCRGLTECHLLLSMESEKCRSARQESPVFRSVRRDTQIPADRPRFDRSQSTKRNMTMRTLSPEIDTARGGSRQRNREVLQQFIRNVNTQEDTPFFARKSPQRLKKRSMQTAKLVGLATMSRSSKHNLQENTHRLNITSRKFIQPKGPANKKRSCRDPPQKCHTQLAQLPSPPVQAPTKHLQTANNEAIDIQDIVLQEKWHQIIDCQLVQPKTAQESLPSQLPPHEPFEVFQSSSDQNLSSDSQPKCMFRSRQEQHPTSVLDIQQEIRSLELALFGKYDQIRELVVLAPPILRPLKVSWQLPLYLLYRRFKQVRDCLTACMQKKQNILEVERWTLITQTHEYQEWLTRLSADNRSIGHSLNTLQHKLESTTAGNRQEILQADPHSRQSQRRLWQLNHQLYWCVKEKALEKCCRSTLSFLCRHANCILLVGGVELQLPPTASDPLSRMDQYLQTAQSHLNKLSEEMNNS